MDQIDIKILRRLQAEGRISNQSLAETVGISAAACWRRVKILEDLDIIKAYTAVLKRETLGLNLCAFVHVTLARHDRSHTKKFEMAINNRPEILECFATTGDADYILRVVTKSIESFDRFLETFLFDQPGISHVRSNIALRELKFETALPIVD